MPNIIFFTEAGHKVGFGHLTRCTALAQALKKQGADITLVINGDKDLLAGTASFPVTVTNWLEKRMLMAFLEQKPVALIDSYLATPPIYKYIADHAEFSVALDDNNRIPYPTDMVVNSGIYAQSLSYVQQSPQQRLLGSQYALLREPFWDIPPIPVREKIEQVMITFGGDDYRQLTMPVLFLLQSTYPHWQIKVLIGQGFKGLSKLEKLANSRTTIYHSLTADEIVSLMSHVDLAISAGGQTLHELARLGIPTVAVESADNQHGNMKGWNQVGFIADAGKWSDQNLMHTIQQKIDAFLPVSTRIHAHTVGISQLDGQGTKRVATAIMQRVNAIR